MRGVDSNMLLQATQNRDVHDLGLKFFFLTFRGFCCTLSLNIISYVFYSGRETMSKLAAICAKLKGDAVTVNDVTAAGGVSDDAQEDFDEKTDSVSLSEMATMSHDQSGEHSQR